MARPMEPRRAKYALQFCADKSRMQIYRRFTMKFLHQLDACKDDDARQVLIHAALTTPYKKYCAKDIESV